MQWMLRRRRDGIAFAARGIALPPIGAFREDTRLETAEDRVDPVPAPVVDGDDRWRGGFRGREEGDDTTR